jgi:hypothetical protein
LPTTVPLTSVQFESTVSTPPSLTTLPLATPPDRTVSTPPLLTVVRLAVPLTDWFAELSYRWKP